MTKSYPYIDKNISVQDDLFRHVNGMWLNEHQMPSDRSTDGAFYEIYQDAEKKTRAIIEEAAKDNNKSGTIEQKIGDLYSAYMDKDAIEKAGKEPIEGTLEEIDQLKSLDDVLDYLPKHALNGQNGVYGFYVSGDPGTPDLNIAHLVQTGIGLPDESYFREDDFEEIRKEYKKYLEKMFTLAGFTDAHDKAGELYDLEEKIAQGHWDNVKCRDAHATYNLTSLKEIKDAYPHLYAWLTSLGLSEKQIKKVNLAQPSYFETIEELLTEENVDALKAKLQLDVIKSFAPYLSDDFVQTNFDFYANKLSGTPEIRERWKRGVSIVEGTLGEGVGQIYVDRHFPESSKEQMEKLVDYLIQAYEESINELPWMGDATKKKAQEKLSKFIPKIGYPDKWRDYSSLEVVPNELIKSLENANKFELEYELNKLGEKVDPNEWLMNPQTVNAYYHPTRNEIVFPAAILSPPFFDPKRDAASNFGAIGAVIGHEIGHGFDDQGSNYDGDGKLIDWWTEDDRKEFTKLTDKLVEQYNQLEPSECPDHTVNGELTLGENIGDLGGLGIAYKAYKLSLEGKEDEVIDGLSGDQRFFFSWAAAWRSMIRPEEALNRLTTDPHSPNEFRCNQIVKNIPAFYEAFDVTNKNDLWLDEDQRVTIW